MIEALVTGKKRFVKTEMPFPDAGSRVPIGLEQLGDRQLIRMNAGGGIRPMDPDLVPHATWITTGQQARPRRTANRSGGIIVR